MLAASSVSIINIDDGWGIEHVEISYAIHTSATDPPGSPLMDEGVVIVDIDGKPLTDGEWSEELPETPSGYFLWTRTVTYYSDGQFSIAYVVGYSGIDGEIGEPGASIVDETEQWYLSTSSTHLVGGSWSYIEPQEIEEGKYLWGRWEFKLSDGTIKYSDAVHRSVLSGLINIADGVNKKITQKIWETDIDNKISAYNTNTVSTIRDRVSSVEQDLSGITSRVANTESVLETKADGSTVAALSNTVSQNEQTASSFIQTVTTTYAKLTDVDGKIGDIKVGANNLYVIADEVAGYLYRNTGTIRAQDPVRKEFTSDYIQVKPGDQYIIQSWCTPNTPGASWLGYQFFSDNSGTPLGNRTAIDGTTAGSELEITADGKEHLTTKTIVPDNAAYLRITYRRFEDGYAMVEKASVASDYAISPRDLQNYTDDQVQSVRTYAEQTADKFEWLVESGDSATNFILTDRTAQLVSDYINLNGTVTFNAFDSATQNALTSGAELIIGTQQSSTSTWTGTSTKLSSIGIGTRISYKLPYASTSSAVTLNLTLNNNTTTGAKSVYYLNETRLTTQYDVNSIVELIYDGMSWRVINPYSDANTYDRTRYQQPIQAGSTAITAGNIIVAGANNIGTYTHLKLGNAFDTTYPILYAADAIAANGTGNNNYLITPMGLTTTQSGTYTAFKSVYIKGTLAGTTFTPVSTTPLTQTIPTSVDNYYYMLLGTMYSTTEMYLLGEHPIFRYYNGGFKTTTQIAAEAATCAANAQAAADQASSDASDAMGAASVADEKASANLGMKVNYENFSTISAGECYLHGYTDGVAADVDGYVYWNDIKRTVPKKMLNPNTVLPYWATIYIVLRLSSSSATTGTLYMVWYNSGWKYAATPTPSAVGGTWTWAETTDIVLGQFIETGNEGQIIDGYLYNPPRNASYVQSTGNNSYQYAKNSVDWVSTNGAGVLTAKTILSNWAEDATQTDTTIKGGFITTHTIASEALMTNAIMSENYQSGVDDSDIPSGPYSVRGSFLDLSTGNLYMPNFGVNGQTGEAYFNGTVNGSAGHFGSTTSYWNIETVRDMNNQQHAALVGTGSPYLQTGNWQISDNAISTRKYTSSSAVSGTINYYKDATTNTFYDIGIKIPSDFSAYDEENDPHDNYNRAFFYGRKYTGNSLPQFDSDWNYVFMVDTDGNIYENGVKLSEKYASVDGVSGQYLPLRGGIISGNLTVNGALTATASSATVLATARDLNVSLSTTTNSGKVSFNGSADKTLGVTGTLGVGNGGTGKTSWTAYGLVYASSSSALAQIGSGSANQVLVSGGSAAPLWTNQSSLIVGEATKATQDSEGNVINTTYRSLSNTTFSSLTVSGNATVSGTLTATLSGSATSVSNNIKIQLNGGTTEGTNQFTYNGSAAKNINITKSNIGLGNVSNDAQVKGLATGTTAGHLVSWGSDGYTVADTGVTLSPQAISGGGTTRGIVSSLASNNEGQIVLTYADGTTSSPIDVTIVASQSTSAAYADALNVNGTQVGSVTQPVYFDNQGKPQVANKIPKLNNASSDSAFYAPTTAGTSGYYLKSNGSGAPTWTSISKSTFGLGNVDNTADANKNVLTATKFSSSRTIALTGDVTGSASGDGSSGWSITTTVADNSHNHSYSTIVPIATKTYTGWIGTSSNNAANDSFYFMKMRPTSFYTQWKIRYRISATISGHTDYASTSDVTLYGSGQSGNPTFSVFNNHYNTSYRPYYYHNYYGLNSTGYSGNCYNAIGLGLRDSAQRNTSGYERTVTVELLEAVNCTCQLLDSGVKWANWESASSNYVSIMEINGYSNGAVGTNSVYVNLDGNQTISGAKTFSAATSITNTTASTSKSTGALKVSGGVGVDGQMSSDAVMIGDAVTLVYDSTYKALCFQFN